MYYHISTYVQILEIEATSIWNTRSLPAGQDMQSQQQLAAHAALPTLIVTFIDGQNSTSDSMKALKEQICEMAVSTAGAAQIAGQALETRLRDKV